MEDLVKTMKALSDETRLRILNVLLERECCVCEIVQALGISQTRASRNLGILEDAGFLKARREGAWMHYSIDRQTANCCAQSLAEILKSFFSSSQVLAADKEKLKQAVRAGMGNCCGQEQEANEKL